MWSKIESIKQIKKIRIGDLITDAPDKLDAQQFTVNVKMGNDLIVVRYHEYPEIKLLTASDLFSGSWWTLLD